MCGQEKSAIVIVRDGAFLRNGKENGIMKNIRRTIVTLKKTAAYAFRQMKRDAVRRRVWKSRTKYILA